MLQGLDEKAASIYAPIRHQLGLVEQRLASLRETTPDYLEPLLDHVLDSGGKRIRSAITLLSADFYSHEMENPVTMAAAVELLHLATLIHDDTVDDSDMRRGRPTVSSLWGKHVAVLFGDFLFATSATFVCETNNVRVIRRFSETIMELASGEMAEYFNIFNMEQAQERYHDRIYRKTASLFRTAGETGSILGGAEEPQVQALCDYGYNIGMAFQMVDDLLDVQGDPSTLGKPVGTDLCQGILTLPTIMLMEKYPEDNPVKALFNDRTEDGHVRRAMDMINNSGIIGDCYTVIRGFCDKATQSLDIMPGCDAKRSLLALPEYIRDRSR